MMHVLLAYNNRQHADARQNYYHNSHRKDPLGLYVYY